VVPARRLHDEGEAATAEVAMMMLRDEGGAAMKVVLARRLWNKGGRRFSNMVHGRLEQSMREIKGES
jgi:hypothetical protein